MRVLLVEDEPGIAQFVRQGLAEAGYAVDVAPDGRSGWDYAIAAEYDIIVLDIMLPEMDGLQLLRQLRSERIKSPVLLLTARDRIEDRVKGLDAGADDYLAKPFAFTELLARLRALLRRPPLQGDTILRVANLEMDVANREVFRDGKQIDLSPREFTLLEYFMRHPRQVLTRDRITEHIWNFDFYGDSNVVDVYVGYLRRKIDREFNPPLLHTVRGVGYRLSAEG
ncbi:response regulator [Aliterella atlantica]|uniref:Transcriptional regulator n=1 Tax=Aliterella atlantica CENA595 TaxID=1618023 RepID=A0A0D8ZS48_9CYAN|nr:response regulator transcription factor [Aliterella atlantica]KJH70036.1 transcriptional regulator [Aliterella atlantica CENA595]